MTVAELIELLKKEDPDATVVVATDCHGCEDRNVYLERHDRLAEVYIVGGTKGEW